MHEVVNLLFRKIELTVRGGINQKVPGEVTQATHVVFGDDLNPLGMGLC